MSAENQKAASSYGIAASEVSADRLYQSIDTDGYVTVRDFFPEDRVLKARNQLQALFDADLEDRQRAEHSAPKYPPNNSTLTDLMRTIRSPSTKSELTARLIADILENEPFAEMIRRVVGPNYQLRQDLVRISSGKNDEVDTFQIPHGWHRDTLGACNFGIFFDDMTTPGSGGTAVIPGTQWEAFAPQWDFALSPTGNFTNEFGHSRRSKYKRLPDDKTRQLPANSSLKDIYQARRTEIIGKPGDVYFFLNDAWHGRWPNTTGRQLMTIRFTLYPSELATFPPRIFPVPRNYPEILRRHYSESLPDNAPNTTLMHRYAGRRRGLGPQTTAWLEKRHAVAVQKLEQDGGAGVVSYTTVAADDGPIDLAFEKCERARLLAPGEAVKPLRQLAGMIANSINARSDTATLPELYKALIDAAGARPDDTDAVYCERMFESAMVRIERLDNLSDEEVSKRDPEALAMVFMIAIEALRQVYARGRRAQSQAADGSPAPKARPPSE
ncbi:hypothetical protein GCM10007420_07310 [Glycocaulis albus]|uniref:Phytanoyl-CoA dioxygenase n=1 Tax=Glycocaulis albus TaxID=1382801 RepID=A0ABQ1XI90_9PROT|nr:phytanoyl-CoA dioxygenase family protein [Glycocaulis albus]GGG94342.1 hypothetical protein GCM10007420_07310 [Glycocaulis albus]